MSYLIDTDICSAYLRQERRATSKFMQHSGRLNISAITAAELWVWSFRRRTSPAIRVGISDLLAGVNVVRFDESAALDFGKIRAALLDAGRSVPTADLLIAATAVHYGLTLVTHNVRDYANVPGLAIEDWLSP